MAQSGEPASDPHHSPAQTCPHIIIAPLKTRWLLISDVEAKNAGTVSFLATQHDFVASRIFLSLVQSSLSFLSIVHMSHLSTLV